MHHADPDHRRGSVGASHSMDSKGIAASVRVSTSVANGCQVKQEMERCR